MGLRTWIGKQWGMKRVDGWYNVPRKIANPVLAQKNLLRGKPDPLIFDIGSHTGESISLYYRDLPQARVYAFEPFPEAYQELAARFEADSRVKTFQLAFAEKSGTVDFFVNNLSMTNSLLPFSSKFTGATTYREAERISVDVTTVDRFCSEQGISHIDILKTDAQGADLQVLRGAEEMLKNSQIDVVFTEVCNIPHYEGQCTFDEVYRFMAQRNYPLCDFLDPHYSDEGQLMWCDLLFRSSKVEVESMPGRQYQAPEKTRRAL